MPWARPFAIWNGYDTYLTFGKVKTSSVKCGNTKCLLNWKAIQWMVKIKQTRNISSLFFNICVDNKSTGNIIKGNCSTTHWMIQIKRPIYVDSYGYEKWDAMVYSKGVPLVLRNKLQNIGVLCCSLIKLACKPAKEIPQKTENEY